MADSIQQFQSQISPVHIGNDEPVYGEEQAFDFGEDYGLAIAQQYGTEAFSGLDDDFEPDFTNAPDLGSSVAGAQVMNDLVAIGDQLKELGRGPKVEAYLVRRTIDQAAKELSAAEDVSDMDRDRIDVQLDQLLNQLDIDELGPFQRTRLSDAVEKLEDALGF